MDEYSISLNNKKQILELFKNDSMKCYSGVFDEKSFYIFDKNSSGLIRKERVINGIRKSIDKQNKFSINIKSNFLTNIVIVQSIEEGCAEKTIVFKSNFFRNKWSCTDLKMNLNMSFSFFIIKKITLELGDDGLSLGLTNDNLELLCYVVLVYFWLKVDCLFTFKQIDYKLTEHNDSFKIKS